MNWYITVNYLKYFLTARHKFGHGIHSPFVYQLIREVFCDKRRFYTFSDVDKYRQELQHDTDFVTDEDFGAGSRISKKTWTVGQKAQVSSINVIHGELLFRLINYFKPKTILELGTAFGVSTLYMAGAAPDSNIYTLEGNEQIAKLALKKFIEQPNSKIRLYTGTFQQKLPNVLQEVDKVDFVFIDGHHNYQATMEYYKQIAPKLHNNSVVLLDDIHWSPEMYRTWKQLQNSEGVTASIELFFQGLLFYRQEMKQQQFCIRF